MPDRKIRYLTISVLSYTKLAIARACGESPTPSFVFVRRPSRPNDTRKSRLTPLIPRRAVRPETAGLRARVSRLLHLPTGPSRGRMREPLPSLPLLPPGSCWMRGHRGIGTSLSRHQRRCTWRHSTPHYPYHYIRQAIHPPLHTLLPSQRAQHGTDHSSSDVPSVLHHGLTPLTSPLLVDTASPPSPLHRRIPALLAAFSWHRRRPLLLSVRPRRRLRFPIIAAN